MTDDVLPLFVGNAVRAAGWMVDKWLGSAPWGLIIGIVLGSAAGLFEFVRLSSKTY